MAADAQISRAAPAPESAQPPVAAESDRQDWPGVVPGDPGYRPATGSEPEEPEEPGTGHRVEPDVIAEIAPPRQDAPLPDEQQPEPFIEVAPEQPGQPRPGGPIAEVRPPQPDPYEPSEQGPIPEVHPPDPGTPAPSEVIVEVAPEVGPAEEDPSRPVEPSEVVTEVAPEVQPSEEDPSRPYEPSEVITEVAPEVSPER